MLSQERVLLQTTSNCWICEGWTQVLFRFTPRVSSSDIVDQYTPVCLHLEIDGFAPDIMLKEAGSEQYSLLRMVPPGRQKYWVR